MSCGVLHKADRKRVVMKKSQLFFLIYTKNDDDIMII